MPRSLLKRRPWAIAGLVAVLGCGDGDGPRVATDAPPPSSPAPAQGPGPAKGRPGRKRPAAIAPGSEASLKADMTVREP